MDFGLSEEQVLLKDTVGRFLAEQCPTARVRQIMEGPNGHDETLWRALAEMGVTGLTVPSEQGGLGMELLDLALIAEELGYATTPGPFLACSMATVALAECEDTAFKERWLPALAAGETLATLAIGEENSEWDLARLAARVEKGALSGKKPLVPYAGLSSLLLVAARDDDGVGLWAVEREAPGLEVRALKGNDLTRRLDSVTFENTPATKVAGGRAALDRAIDAGLVLIAADAYGGVRRCLEMSVEYALQREQFGQVIGAFQAIKHQLANMAADIEPSLSLYWYAAHAFDHIKEKAARHAAMAKAHLTDLYDRVARDATEIHGGIGFTWEFDLHLWFRRSIFDRSYLGDAAFHRERAAELAGW